MKQYVCRSERESAIITSRANDEEEGVGVGKWSELLIFSHSMTLYTIPTQYLSCGKEMRR